MRWESTGEGDYTVETVEQGRRAAPTSSCTCAPEEDELLSGARLREILRKYSDHITVPILMKKERWDATAQAQVVDRRGRAGQPGVGAVGAAQVGDHRRAVPRVLQARRARLRAAAGLHARQGRRPPGIHAAALHPAARAVRPVGPRAPARHQALRPPRLHHGRRRAADAGVPALRARRRSTRTTCRSTSRARSCSSRATCRRSAPRRSSACSACSRIWPSNQPEKYATFWKEFGRVLKEGVAEDAGEPRADRQAAALRVDARATATSRPSRSPTTSAG